MSSTNVTSSLGVNQSSDTVSPEVVTLETTLEVTNSSVVQTSDTVSPVVEGLVTKIKSIANELKEIQTQKNHWKKREFDFALMCGETLSKIRSTFGENGHGFKLFVESTFEKEFSYKTSLRYMKLFTKKNELTPDIDSLRKAYVKLEIITPDNYLYPKNKVVTKEVSTVVEKKVTGNPVSTNSESKVPENKELKSDVNPFFNGIVLCVKKSDSNSSEGYDLIEFIVNEDKCLTFRNTKGDGKTQLVKEKGMDYFYNALTPFIGWYCEETNKRNPIIQFMKPESPKIGMVA